MTQIQPSDFPANTQRYGRTKPIGTVPVYVDLTTGQFCAHAPHTGFVRRSSYADLEKALRQASFEPFDAIYTARSTWRRPSQPMRVRVIGFRRNPKFGGKWVYQEYTPSGTLTERTLNTDESLIPYTAEAWSLIRDAWERYDRSLRLYNDALNKYNDCRRTVEAQRGA